MKLAFVLLSCVLGCLAAEAAAPMVQELPENISYKDCGSPNDVVRVDSIQVTPDTVKASSNVVMTAKITVMKPITEGAYAIITAMVGGYTAPEQRLDLCEMAREHKANFSCPLTEGKHTLVHTIKMPYYIPKGNYSGHTEGYSAEGARMFCADTSADFSS